MRRLGSLTPLVLVPLAVGCGSEGAGEPAAASDAGSSRVEIDFVLEKKHAVEATGAFDYGRDAGELRFDQVDESLGPAPTEFRLIGDTVYSGWRLGGKLHWQKDEEDEPLRAEDLIVPFGGRTEPDNVHEVLEKASRQTQKLGTELIRGVPTKKYGLRIGEDEVLAQFGVENALDDHADKVLTVTAWFDDADLVRRLVFEASEDGEGPTTYDFYDYGIPVEVHAPPTEDMLSEAKLYPLLLKECEREHAKTFCESSLEGALSD